MSLSTIGSSILHCSGHLARRSLKPQHVTGLRKSLLHNSSNGRSLVLSPSLPNVSWQSPHTLLASRLGSGSNTNIEVFSCGLVNKLHYSSLRPYSSWTDAGRSSKGLLLHNLEILILPEVDRSALSGFPVSQQLRFSSSQKRSKDIRVLSRREAQNFGKGVRNARGNSEKAGGRSKTPEEAAISESPEEDEKKLSLYQRFKKTYKEHGKVLVAVHVATSIVWFSTFYAAASLGFDIVPLLESWNMSERVISPFRSGGLGNVALAYLFYKLATPARYTVTIAGTRYAIGYLQKEGRMKKVPKADSLRSLYKEGKEDIKGRSRKRMTMIRRKARARRMQRNSGDQSSGKP